MDYAAPETICTHCKVCFEHEVDPGVMVPYGGCDHMVHELCSEDMIARAAFRDEQHLLCGVCQHLLWIKVDEATSGITLHREHVDDILYNGKCIENRSQNWAAGYYWLRTDKKSGTRRSPPGSIVALIHLGADVAAEDVSPMQEPWYLDDYSFHFPIRLIWTLPKPIEWTPPRGAQSRFRVPQSLLHRLIKY